MLISKSAMKYADFATVINTSSESNPGSFKKDQSYHPKLKSKSLYSIAVESSPLALYAKQSPAKISLIVHTSLSDKFAAAAESNKVSYPRKLTIAESNKVSYPRKLTMLMSK